MSVSPGSSKGKGGKFGKMPRGVCWNCGEKGHFKDKCPKPAKSTKDPKKNNSQKSGSANTAVQSDSDSEGAFAMEPDLESVSDCISEDEFELDGVFNPEYEEDWFSEEENNLDGYEKDIFPLEESGAEEDLDWFNEPEEAHAAIIKEDIPIAHAEIYDSGCSRHITPYRKDLLNFTEIPVKPFRAANKQSFNATGTGELVIDVPNGLNNSKLQLTEVLYSPEVGYTLVSVGNLDDCGFTVTFGNGKCTITGPYGERVG